MIKCPMRYFEMLKRVFAAYKLIAMSSFIENLRMIKDAEES